MSSSGHNKFGRRNFTRRPNHPAGLSNSYSFSRRNNRSFSGGKQRKRWTETIDISKFVRKAVEGTQEAIAVKNSSFDNFELCPQLKKNLTDKGYLLPTPIQDQAINLISAHKDIVGLADTGTGKTAAFLLPLVERVYKDRLQKVLIIAPTRELALQIDQELRQFAYSMGIFSAICVGGMPIFKQISSLRRNPNFVIGTPGRLKDLSQRNQIRFANFSNVVIDEIDRMLDMGFIEDIRGILSQLPEKRQSLFFSATIPPKIRSLVSQFSADPVFIEVKSEQTADNIDQDIVRVADNSMKFNQLQELLRNRDLKKVLIFIETKREVEKLASDLVRKGFRADSIHGDKKQYQRQRALSCFRENKINILVATDVAARGLDIKDITHVINYTVPQTYLDYIHRIGRTGRANNKGAAYTFVGA